MNTLESCTAIEKKSYTSSANEDALASILSPFPIRENILLMMRKVADSAGTKQPI